MDVAWTTNPIGFSERFTIRTDSHQHTNTNIGLHARTDREFLHSTSYRADADACAVWPADKFNTSERRRRPAPEAVRSMPGSRARRTSAGTSNYRARGVIHTGRDAQGRSGAAPTAQPQTKNPTPKGTRMDGARAVQGPSRPRIALVSRRRATPFKTDVILPPGPGDAPVTLPPHHFTLVLSPRCPSGAVSCLESSGDGRNLVLAHGRTARRRPTRPTPPPPTARRSSHHRQFTHDWTRNPSGV